MAPSLGGTEPHLPLFCLASSFRQNDKCQAMQPRSDHVRTTRHFFNPCDDDFSLRPDAKLYAVPGSRHCEPFLVFDPPVFQPSTGITSVAEDAHVTPYRFV